MSRTTFHRIRRAFVAVGILAVAGGSLTALPAASVDTGVQSTYLVLYNAGAKTSGAQKDVESAGGTLVANYSAIGVVIARSSRSDFSAALNGSPGVDSAVATGRFATKVQDTSGSDQSEAVAAGASWGDSLSGRQWDMRQINVPQAHSVNSGSRSVVVGDIDTGLDFTHPDLAPNYDASRSADCSSGTPQPLAVGNDKNGHGTHTAGTIAAASNGTGIIGVAPNVSIAGIKSSNDDGYFFPEMVICSFVWAATHGVNVTNNSYFADPWLFNCRNDAGQRAIWNAERRAIGYAQSKGVLVVAAEGNESTDLSHPTTDVRSPDFPPNSEVERSITNACAVVPVEMPGVVGVTATGNKRLKSFYSSYGTSSTDVAAPGGDSVLQLTADAPNGRVLSTWSSTSTTCLPSRLVVENGAKYCYQQGTSMAAPHATGVAALLLSAHGAMNTGQLTAALQRETNSLSCPADTSIYGPFPQNSGAPQSCQGGAGHNSWYGSGEVDALKAVQ